MQLKAERASTIRAFKDAVLEVNVPLLSDTSTPIVESVELLKDQHHRGLAQLREAHDRLIAEIDKRQAAAEARVKSGV